MRKDKERLGTAELQFAKQENTAILLSNDSYQYLLTLILFYYFPLYTISFTICKFSPILPLFFFILAPRL